MNKLSNNTHDYDSKLKETISKIKLKYPISGDFENSLYEISKINNEIAHDKKDIVNKTINLLTNDKHNNYDPTNNVSIEELLPRLIIEIKNWDNGAKIICLEQVADIYEKGSCPQGRCTRIIQLFDV